MTFTIDATTHVSPNQSARVDPKPRAIVLHTGEGTRQSDLSWLKKPQGEKSVSSHYYVCRDGTIYQLVPDWREAWHAGPGSYLGYTNWGDFSLGIETEHRQGQDWPQVQRDALVWLCKLLIQKYDIRQNMVIAHRWIVRPPGTGKKIDPSNWPDPDLAAWIANLYVIDWQARWGPHYPYFEASGIAAAWRPLAAQLGAAVSDETKDARGHIWRLFEHGAIEHDPVTGVNVPYLPRSK